MAEKWKKVAAYGYLLVGYIVIEYNFSYGIRMTSKPIGSMLLVLFTLGYYLVYILLNHLLIKRFVSSKILIIIEIVLIITLVTLFYSDETFVNRRDYLLNVYQGVEFI